MSDMLVRLYDLPSPRECYRRAEEAGVVIRRAEPWDRPRLRSFVEAEFGDTLWPLEVDVAFTRLPITAFVATAEGAVVGFAVYECTRRNFFGPTGVRRDLRGRGVGTALLFRCLEAMRDMGYAYAVIGGVGPAEYYQRVCGAFPIPESEPGIYGTVGG